MRAPELRDPDLVLRPASKSDAAELYEAACESIEQVYPWLPWCHPGYTLAEAEQWLARQEEGWRAGSELQFAIRDAHSERLFGGCGLNMFHPVHRFANLGYWVRTSETGRGVASRAARLVAGFGLRDVGFLRIEILVHVRNLASQRVAEKAGAVREGILRQRLYSHGAPHDAVMFSLVRADLETS